MPNKIHTWLISPKSFIEMIGGEYELLRKSGAKTLLKFYLSALLIFFILIISWISIYYATSLLFHSSFVEIFLSAFISILFVFIYIFLLHTFSKNPLQADATKTNRKWEPFFRLTNIVRMGFVMLMAFLMSKPLEAFIFRSKIDNDVNEYRERILNNYTFKIEKLYGADIQKLDNRITKYQTELSSIAGNEIKILNEEILSLKKRQKENIHRATERVNHAEFLLFRIKRVAKNPVAWMCCAGIVILFILPGFLIYSISGNNIYYELKKAAEKDLVKNEFVNFLLSYNSIFEYKFKYKISYYSEYEDPPFNTVRKPKPIFASQSDFLNKFSNEL